MLISLPPAPLPRLLLLLLLLLLPLLWRRWPNSMASSHLLKAASVVSVKCSKLTSLFRLSFISLKNKKKYIKWILDSISAASQVGPVVSFVENVLQIFVVVVALFSSNWITFPLDALSSYLLDVQRSLSRGSHQTISNLITYLLLMKGKIRNTHGSKHEMYFALRA